MPVPTGFGLVWQSSVDPGRVNTLENRPVLSAAGITSAIDLVVVVDATATGKLGEECRQEIIVDGANGSGATSCLDVQWRFDVDPSFPVNTNSDQGSLTCDPLVTAEGRQVTQPFVTSGFPGTKGNVLACGYPFGGYGSVIHWSIGSNLVGYTKASYKVPPSMPPVSF